MDAKQEQELRQYAAGDLAWRTMRNDGWRYTDVLNGLGALNLRPPIAGNDGPNAPALARGRAIVRMLLARQAQP